jgi:hypothetical protein
MANIPNAGFSRTSMEETQQQITQPRAEVWEEKKRGVDFPGHNMVKAAIEIHPAMVSENQTDGYLTCQNGTTKNPQTRWKSKGTGAPLPQQVPPWPGTPPVPSDHDKSSETEGVPPAYVYTHTPHPSGWFLPRIPCTMKILFQICWLMMVHWQVSTLSAAWWCSRQPCWWRGQPLEWIWQRRWELTYGNCIFEYYHYLQLADTLQNIIPGLFICIIKEQCSNKGERT